MQLGPKFITVDEFDNYWTANLREMLRTSANESNQAEMFLARVERRLMAYIDNNTFRRYKYEELVGYQLEAFKEAIILQAMYVYKNGDLGMESGYNAESGFVAKRSELIEISLCQDAIDILSNAGLWNMVMKNRPRKFGGVLFGDYYSGGTGWPAPAPTPTPVPDPEPTPTPTPTPIETYTITLMATNGSWNRSTITEIANGTELSFDITTLVLTIGNQTARFIPNEGYIYTSITYAEQYITKDGIVRAIASIAPTPTPTGSTITLLGTNGTWDTNSITAENGTEYSFNETTLTLTVGNQTAVFTPKNGSIYYGITHSSGILDGDISIVATANPVLYTVTLSSQNGSWNKLSFVDIPYGTNYSFDSYTKTLTVGNQTAVFTPDYEDEFDNYIYNDISSSSGSITSNTTITAYAIFNPNIEEITGSVFIDNNDSDEAEIYFSKTPDKVKIWFDILGYSNTNEIDSDEYSEIDPDEYIDGIEKIISKDERDGIYTPEYTGYWEYGELAIHINLTNDNLTLSVVNSVDGNDGKTVIEIWKMRAI